MYNHLPDGDESGFVTIALNVPEPLIYSPFAA